MGWGPDVQLHLDWESWWLPNGWKKLQPQVSQWAYHSNFISHNQTLQGAIIHLSDGYMRKHPFFFTTMRGIYPTPTGTNPLKHLHETHAHIAQLNQERRISNTGPWNANKSWTMALLHSLLMHALIPLHELTRSNLTFTLAHNWKMFREREREEQIGQRKSLKKL